MPTCQRSAVWISWVLEMTPWTPSAATRTRPFGEDAIEGLIDAALGLEDQGQAATHANFRGHQVDVADLARQVPRPVAIAVADLIVTPFMALGAVQYRNLQLDQLLQAVAHQLEDQLPGCAAIK